jgi:hypothetical protein
MNINSETSKKGMILRWLLFLPLSILVYFTIIYGFTFLNWISSDNSILSNLINIYITPIVSYALACYYFVIVGREIVPSHKKEVSASLFTIGLFIVLFTIFYNYKILNRSISLWQYFGWVVGAISSWYAAFVKDYKEA